MNLRPLGTGKKIALQLYISHIPVYILASPPGAGMSPLDRSFATFAVAQQVMAFFADASPSARGGGGCGGGGGGILLSSRGLAWAMERAAGKRTQGAGFNNGVM